MQNLPWKKNKKYVQAALTVTCLSILLYFLLSNFSNIWNFIVHVVEILQPILIGILLAYLMSPICNKIEQRLLKYLLPRCRNKKTAEKWAGWLSVTASIIIIILVVIAFLALIIPQLTSSVSDLIGTTAHTEDNFTKVLEKSLAGNPELEKQAVTAWQNIADWIDNYFSTKSCRISIRC